eukprot:4917089-Lingulodinium_polyedra.AAC.1
MLLSMVIVQHDKFFLSLGPVQRCAALCWPLDKHELGGETLFSLQRVRDIMKVPSRRTPWQW